MPWCGCCKVFLSPALCSESHIGLCLTSFQVNELLPNHSNYRLLRTLQMYWSSWYLFLITLWQLLFCFKLNVFSLTISPISCVWRALHILLVSNHVNIRQIEIWMIKMSPLARWSGFFQWGSEIWTCLDFEWDLISGSPTIWNLEMGTILSKTIWNPDANVRISKTGSFEIQPSKSRDFKCFWISYGRISDPQCRFF